MRNRPKGAELDHWVLWAIAVLGEHLGRDYPLASDVHFYVTNQLDRWPIDGSDYAFGQMVGRSLARLEKTGVIERTGANEIEWKLVDIRK